MTECLKNSCCIGHGEKAPFSGGLAESLNKLAEGVSRSR